MTVTLASRQSYEAASRCKLSLQHIAELQASGLNDETIAASGIYTGGTVAIGNLLGMRCTEAGMVIPYHTEDEYVRVKMMRAGTAAKYLSPKGSRNHLYIPPMVAPEILAKVEHPLWITEGEKKALKACQEGLACIALPGVWGWKTKEDGESQPIADLDAIAWETRTVYLVFDSDLEQNPQIAKAEGELAKELARRGAIVYSTRLPGGSDGKKVGLDDYLMVHSLEVFRALPSRQIAPRILASGLGRFLGQAFPPATPLIRDIFPSDGCGWIAGEEKLGKSFYALEEALCLALGMPVCGQFEVIQRQRVLFIEEEDTPQRIKTRVDALLRGHGRDPEDPQVRAELDQWFQLSVWNSVSLDDPDMVLALDRTVAQFKPRVVYLDALRKMTARDLNPQHEASKLVNTLDTLRRRHGCLFRVLHHYRKGQGFGRAARGSQEIIGSFVLGAWAEVSLFFEPIGKQYGVAKVQVQTKDGTPRPPFKMVIESEGPQEAPTLYRLRIEELGTDQRDLAFAEEVYELTDTLDVTLPETGQAGVSLSGLSTALHLKADSKRLREVLKKLIKEGRLKHVGTGKKGAKLYQQAV